MNTKVDQPGGANAPETEVDLGPTKDLDTAIAENREYDQPTPGIPSENDEVDDGALPHNPEHPTGGEEERPKPMNKREAAIQRQVERSKKSRGLATEEDEDGQPVVQHMDELLENFPTLEEARAAEEAEKSGKSQQPVLTEQPGKKDEPAAADAGNDADPLVPVTVDGQIQYKKWSEVRALVEVPVAIDKRHQELGALNEQIRTRREELDRTVEDPEGNTRRVTETPQPRTKENPDGLDLDQIATVEEMDEMLVATPERSREIFAQIMKRNRASIDPSEVTNLVNQELERREQMTAGTNALNKFREDYKDVMVGEDGKPNEVLQETVYATARRTMVSELRRMGMPEEWLSQNEHNNVAIMQEYTNNLRRPEIVEYYKPKLPINILREAGDATRALVSPKPAPGNGGNQLDLETRRERARSAQPVPQRAQQRGEAATGSPTQRVASIDEQRLAARRQIRKNRPGTRSRQPT